MDAPVTPYKNSLSKKEQVATMFNNIAHRYDFLNSLLSLGIHVFWRKKAIRLLKKDAPKSILDIATGTADFAIEALSLHPTRVVGVDISKGMLDLGQRKLERRGLADKIVLQLADSESLPFESNSFDAVTVGFGVRNFEHLEIGLKDILRVLKPGGTLVVLEFSKPSVPLIKWLYDFYFRRITPFIGKLFSKDASAYTYLPESVAAFPDGEHFTQILTQVGFRLPSIYRLTFSIASIYVAKK